MDTTRTLAYLDVPRNRRREGWVGAYQRRSVCWANGGTGEASGLWDGKRRHVPGWRPSIWSAAITRTSRVSLHQNRTVFLILVVEPVSVKLTLVVREEGNSVPLETPGQVLHGTTRKTLSQVGGVKKRATIR